MVTPGYRVTVEANGQQYVYHTDATGQNIRRERAPGTETPAGASGTETPAPASQNSRPERRAGHRLAKRRERELHRCTDRSCRV